MGYHSTEKHLTASAVFINYYNPALIMQFKHSSKSLKMPSTKIKLIFPAFILLIVFTGCKKDEQPTPSDSTRSFYMSFTPFPYEISYEAVDWTYAHIAADADMITHSFDEGIPWVQALNDEPFSAHIMDDWTYRKNNSPAGHKIFIQQSCETFERDGMALIKDTADNQPLIAPWDTIHFNHPDVKTAYLNYCKRMIDFFEPDYFNFSIEGNILLSFNPAIWNEYKEFHEYIYTQLKTLYPELAILFSFQCSFLLDGQIDGVDYIAQHQAVTDLLPYTDVFGISIYPYATALLTNLIPEDMIDDLAAMAGTKPMAITETGYISKTLELTDPPITIPSDEQKQNNYISFILEEANQHHFLFVNNFILRDYDKLWEQIGGVADISALWRNTGLYDSAGVEKQALTTWKLYLDKPHE